MKTIDTLINDIHQVVKGEGGWDQAAANTWESKLPKLHNNVFPNHLNQEATFLYPL